MVAKWREPAHLAGRFFDVVSSRRLTPGEQQEVSELLVTRFEHQVYWDQSIADQRHGLSASRFVRDAAPARRDLTRAALLHDIGKRHAQLDVIGRVFASLVRFFGAPGWGRLRSYIDHGQIGGDELRANRAGDLIWRYAAHHHGARPPEISIQEWGILDGADRAKK